MNQPSSQSAKVSRVLIGQHARPLVLFWIILLVIYQCVTIGIALWGHLGHSIWESAFEGVALYFPMGLGLLLTPMHLPVFVANGVTRRDFGTGTLWLVGFFTLVSAIGLTAGYALEDLVFALNGRPDVLNSPQFFSSTGQFGAIFCGALLQVSAYLCSGWLIGTGFRRFGWRGVFFLLPALLPVLGTGVLTGMGWLGRAASGIGIGVPPVAVGVPVLAALILLGLGTSAVLIRTVSAGRPRTPQTRFNV